MYNIIKAINNYLLTFSFFKVIKERQLFPFLDSAYQGYASGDLDHDAWAVRLFLNSGLNFIVAQSFAKNMGLYGERAGALHFVCPNKDSATKVGSQVKLVIRPMYSNPPLHAARLAGFILANQQLREEWKAELREVSQRIIQMRKVLRDELVRLQVPGKWDHIVEQIGMFSYTGLNKQQCEVLIDKWHIYLIKNGRISMAGVTSKNVGYLAKAIKDAIESTSK
jgi:aspartate/tyrosine/aromatic aminotransferase